MYGYVCVSVCMSGVSMCIYVCVCMYMVESGPEGVGKWMGQPCPLPQEALLWLGSL